MVRVFVLAIALLASAGAQAENLTEAERLKLANVSDNALTCAVYFMIFTAGLMKRPDKQTPRVQKAIRQFSQYQDRMAELTAKTSMAIGRSIEAIRAYKQEETDRMRIAMDGNFANLVVIRRVYLKPCLAAIKDPTVLFKLIPPVRLKQ